MKYKTVFFIIFLSLIIQGCTSDKSISYKFDTKYKAQIKEKLGHPFGTIVNLEAKVIDGNNLPLKGTQGRYLLQVKAVNKTKLDTLVTMFFEDESCNLTADSIQSSFLNKNINLIGYETGKFRGIPNGYSKYKMTKSGFVYGFHNYLIILSKPK